MKKYLFIVFIFLFSLGYTQPAHAQGAVGHTIKRGIIPSVSFSSQISNLALAREMIRAAETAAIPTTTLTSEHIFKQRKYPYRSTFQLQHSSSPLATSASGFAILLHGKVWGVTTAHVAKKISPHYHHPKRSPYMRVQTGPESFHIFPIKKFYISNPEGIDLALFEIPEEAIPYITVTHPAKRAPTYGEEITVRGFKEEMFITVRNNGRSERMPLSTYLSLHPEANKQSLFDNNFKMEVESQAMTLEHQKVVFSTPTRLFLKNPPAEDITGFCGAPGFTNGLVSSVYAGFDLHQLLMRYDWFQSLPEETKRSLANNMQYAIPINVVEAIAKSIEETGSIAEAGIMMRVFDHPVALLHANESIVHIEQFRNGEKITQIDGGRHAPINPEKLELFFELQEDDILRITLDSFSTERPMPSVVYDVNVSTGLVTTVSPKKNLASGV